MTEPTLVAVHPGYGMYRGHVSDRYGDYDDYLKQLKSAVWSLDSIIFLYREDKPPFELPDGAEVMQDRDRNTCSGVNTKRLISRLKEREANTVYLGGEFLWEYFQLIDDEGLEAFRNTGEKELEGIPSVFGDWEKELQSVVEFANETRIKDCCVMGIYEALKDEFDVRFIRNIIYPTIDPQPPVEVLAAQNPDSVTAVPSNLTI